MFYVAGWTVFKYLTLAVVMLACAASAEADEFDRTLARFRAASGTAPFFSGAYGYAVFPTIGKGGFVIGGAYGEGRVYRAGVHVGDTSMVRLFVNRFRRFPSGLTV